MEFDERIETAINEAEKSVKAVWEIDGTTVYITNVVVNNGQVTVDWFTFRENCDKAELGRKIDDLAKHLLKPQKQSWFDRIISFFS